MVDWNSAKSQVKGAKYWAVSGTVLGALAFPIIEYLDGNDLSVTSALIGAGVGGILGTGVGILVNAARDNKVENYVVAVPLLGMGGTMAALKAYPNTRHDSNKRLISNGLVGGIVGLTLGGGIDYLT